MRFARYDDRESLERIKRWPHLVNRCPTVRIYSAEHQAYWMGSGNGYTTNPLDSDVWQFDLAVARTLHCGPEKQIQFVFVDEQDTAGRKTVAQELTVLSAHMHRVADLLGRLDESSGEAPFHASELHGAANQVTQWSTMFYGETDSPRPGSRCEGVLRDLGILDQDHEEQEQQP